MQGTSQEEQKDSGADQSLSSTENETLPRQPLRALIFRNYLFSALIPIFTIEVLLLLMYFGVNWYIAEQNKETLLQESRETLPHIAHQASMVINTELHEISNLSSMLQSENQRFFKNPELFPIPGPPPQFATAENGVFYKTNQVGCSLIYFNGTVIGPTEYAKAYQSESFDPLFEQVVENQRSVVAVYFNSFDNMNRLYPFIEKVYAQYPPNMNIPEYNFYYLADAAHNPSREAVWTGAYLDPAGQGWMVSCIVPIYRGDFLEGVTGLDVTTERFVQQTLNLQLPWKASAFMTDASGMILAMPETVENVLGLQELKRHTYNKTIDQEVHKPEEYTLTKNPNPAIARQFDAILGQDSVYTELSIGAKDYLVAQARIQATGWRVMIMVDKDELFAPIYVLNRLSHRIGIGLVIIMIVFYVVFFLLLLRRSFTVSQQIAIPVRNLATATAEVGKNESLAALPLTGIDEIDQLSTNFNQMSQELDERTQALIASQIREQLAAQEAEIAYNTGLFESASSYLHNIGNSLGAVDGKISLIRQTLDAIAGYRQAFELIRQAHLSGHPPTQDDETIALVNRMEALLLAQVLPRLNQYLGEISEIRNHMVLTIKHQQEMFSQRHQHADKYIQDIDLGELVSTLMNDLRPMAEKVRVTMAGEWAGKIMVRNQKHQLMHGLLNVIKNAIEAIGLSETQMKGRVDIRIKPPGEAGGRAEIRVRDNGIGIKQEDLPNLFKAGFTTKEGGHGLGLHSFLMFLKENSGNISVESAGLGQGAEFIIEIGNE